MALLIIYDNPFTPECTKEVIPEGVNLGEWLVEYHRGGFGRPFTMYYNMINEQNVITPETAQNYIIGRYDKVIVVLQPMVGLAAAIIAPIVAIATVGLSIALAPDIPEPFDEEESSGTNKIKGQANLIRTNDRIPRIFGEMRVFPDLIIPSYYTFERRSVLGGTRVETEQVLTEYFCIGEGGHTVRTETAKQGDDLISRTNNVSVEYYTAGRTEPQDLYYVKESTIVKNIEVFYPVGGEDVNVATSFKIAASGKTATIETNSNVVNANQVFQILDLDSPNAGKLFSVITEVSGSPRIYTVLSNEDIVSEWRDRTEILVLDESRDRIYNDAGSSDPKVIGGADIAYDVANDQYDVTTSGSSPSGIVIANSEDFSTIDLYGVGDLINMEWDGDPDSDYSGMFEITAIRNNRVFNANAPFPIFYLRKADHSSYLNIDPAEPVDGTTLGGDRSSWNVPRANIWRVATAAEVSGVTNIAEVNAPSHITPMSCTDIWIDVAFKQGLYRIQGSGERGDRTVSIEVSAVECTPDGAIVNGGYSSTFTKSWTENTTNPLRFTLKASEEFASFPTSENYYNVTVRRTNRAKNSGNETLTWDRLAAVVDLKTRFDDDEVDHGNVTTCRVTTRVVSGVPVPENRKFNVVVRPNIPVHSETSTLDHKTIYAGPTTKWMDALLYTARRSDTGAGLSPANIDYDSIFEVQRSLDAEDGGLSGEFNHVFSTRASIDEELAIIGNAARATIYRVGDKIFASRDEKGKRPIALFNRRNKVGDGDVRVIDFNQENKIDYIEFTYISRELNYQKYTARYPDTYDDIYDPSINYSNPKRITLDGIVHWRQAWKAAVFAYNIDRHRRDKLIINTTSDSRVLNINDVVVNADMLTFNLLDGEVIEYKPPREVTLDQDVSNIPNGSSIELRSQISDAVERIYIVNVKTASNSIMLSETPSFDITTSMGKSVGTLYRIIAPTDVNKEYIVKGISASEDSVELTLEEYNEAAVYAAESTSVPSFPAPYIIEPEGLVWTYLPENNEGSYIGSENNHHAISQWYNFEEGLLEADNDSPVLSSKNVLAGSGYAKFNGQNSYVNYAVPWTVFGTYASTFVIIANITYRNKNFNPLYAEQNANTGAPHFGVGIGKEGYVLIKWKSSTGPNGDAYYQGNSTIKVAENEDFHLAITRIFDDILIRINGVPAGTVSLSNPTGYTVDYGTLGAWSQQVKSNYPSLDGTILDWRVSDAAVGESRKLDDFNKLFAKR